MTRIHRLLGLVVLFGALTMPGCRPSPVYPVATVDTHSISLVVNDPAVTLEEIRAMGISMNGTIDGWNVQFNAFPYLGVTADQASISLRVPPDRIDEALSRIKGAATQVTYCRVNRTDVAEEYEGLLAAVHELENSEAELLQSIDAASTLQGALAADEQLLGVQSELLTARSRIAHLEESASLISVGVDLLPVEVGPIEAPGPCSHLPSP